MLIWLKTVWAGVKKYWGLIAVVLGGLIAFFVLRDKGVSFADEFEKVKENHDDELKRIEEARRLEQKAHEDNLKRLEATITAVQEQYDAAKQQLDSKKKAQVEAIVKKHGDDPEELARQLSEATGFTVILPE